MSDHDGPAMDDDSPDRDGGGQPPPGLSANPGPLRYTGDLLESSHLLNLTPPELSVPAGPSGLWPQVEVVQAPRKNRLWIWLHLLLFLLTLVSTSAVGARFQRNFVQGRPAWELGADLNPFAGLRDHPERSITRFMDGLPFALSLLFILSIHELGHLVACWHYDIDASYPYFIPAPTIIGTMGAFIRIKSMFRTRASLFDVGIWGPLAGFAAALPFLVVGLAMSRVTPGIYIDGTVSFDFPPLFQLLNLFLHPGVSQFDIALHPLARAAWVGLFATALNLIPAGQLDGGHILYALSPRWHRVVSLSVAALLGLPMVVMMSCWGLARWFPSLNAIADLVDDFYWPGWFLWGVLLIFLGRRHPPVYDPHPLDAGRRALAVLALLVFLLCFAPIPFRTF
jgi:Zn-dependent protease